MESTEAGVVHHQQHTHSKNISTKLTTQQLYQHDPLLILLKDKWHLNITHFIMGSLLLSVVCFLGLHALAGLPFTPKGNLIRLLDVLTSVLFYGVYFYLPTSIANLFNKLIEDRVIDNTSQGQTGLSSYLDLLSKFKTSINSLLWLLLALPFIIPYLYYRVLITQFSPAPEPLWLRLVGSFIDLSIGYTGFLSIMRISVSLYFLRQLLRSFIVRINPLHPDGAGGLGILRQILWNSAGIMLGIALAFYEDSIHSFRIVDIALLTAAYVILFPSMLMGWLILPHLVMLQARKALLQPLTNEYETLISEVRAVTNYETAKIKNDTERLSALTDRYELYRKTFPIWPLEVVQMRQLLIVFILPILAAFITIIPAIPSMINYFMRQP